jgi:hypothetical protein
VVVLEVLYSGSNAKNRGAKLGNLEVHIKKGIGFKKKE